MSKCINRVESFFKSFIDKWMIKLEFKKDVLILNNETINRYWLSINIQELNSYKPSVDWYWYKTIWWTYIIDSDESIDACIQHIIMCIIDKCINVIQDLNWINKEYDLVKKNIF